MIFHLQAEQCTRRTRAELPGCPRSAARQADKPEPLFYSPENKRRAGGPSPRGGRKAAPAGGGAQPGRQTLTRPPGRGAAFGDPRPRPAAAPRPALRSQTPEATLPTLPDCAGRLATAQGKSTQAPAARTSESISRYSAASS